MYMLFFVFGDSLRVFNGKNKQYCLCLLKDKGCTIFIQKSEAVCFL